MDRALAVAERNTKSSASPLKKNQAVSRKIPNGEGFIIAIIPEVEEGCERAFDYIEEGDIDGKNSELGTLAQTQYASLETMIQKTNGMSLDKYL